MNAKQVLTRKKGERDRKDGQVDPSQQVGIPKLWGWHGYGVLDVPNGVQVHDGSLEQQVELVNYVRSAGGVNVLTTRIPIKTGWNIRLLSQLASSPSDREVVQYLLFGWPINHDGREVTVNKQNHSTALLHKQDVDKYVQSEL